MEKKEYSSLAKNNRYSVPKKIMSRTPKTKSPKLSRAPSKESLMQSKINKNISISKLNDSINCTPKRNLKTPSRLIDTPTHPSGTPNRNRAKSTLRSGKMKSSLGAVTEKKGLLQKDPSPTRLRKSLDTHRSSSELRRQLSKLKKMTNSSSKRGITPNNKLTEKKSMNSLADEALDNNVTPAKKLTFKLHRKTRSTLSNTSELENSKLTATKSRLDVSGISNGKLPNNEDYSFEKLKATGYYFKDLVNAYLRKTTSGVKIRDHFVDVYEIFSTPLEFKTYPLTSIDKRSREIPKGICPRTLILDMDETLLHTRFLTRPSLDAIKMVSPGCAPIYVRFINSSY